MKKIKALLISCCALGLLVACENGGSGSGSGSETAKTFTSLEINEYPKQVFYCGENFSNNGISLKVNFSDGSSFVTEDVVTSKPASMMIPGTQTIKAYYTNDEYDINTFVSYDIEIIDWTTAEKAVFGQTSICSLAGVYYPKMEGMKLVTEFDEVTGEVTDYYIELENASLNTLLEYAELLRDYSASKTIVQNGQQYTLDFKFYECPTIPSDFFDLYGEEMPEVLCFRYCSSYQYIDQTYGEIHNLYGNDVEDTLVFGLTAENKLVIRFIANSVLLETMFQEDVNNRLDLGSLFLGKAYTYLKQSLLGYVDEEGKRYLGAVEEIAPMAVEHFHMTDVEPDVMAIADNAALNPWEHGEDNFCFTVQLASTESDYNAFLSTLDADSAFTKTTKTSKYGRKDVTMYKYTIENMDYVGNLEINVIEYIPDSMNYTKTDANGKSETVKSGSYLVTYIFQAPEKFSPTLDELYRIYDICYGADNYNKNSYDRYEDGMAGGIVKYNQFKQTADHQDKGANEVESKEEAFDKFVTNCLTGYTAKEAAEAKDLSGYEVYTGKYMNDDYIVTVVSYFAGNGKFAVEFTVEINKM